VLRGQSISGIILLLFIVLLLSCIALFLLFDSMLPLWRIIDEYKYGNGGFVRNWFF